MFMCRRVAQVHKASASVHGFAWLRKFVNSQGFRKSHHNFLNVHVFDELHEFTRLS